MLEGALIFWTLVVVAVACFASLPQLDEWADAFAQPDADEASDFTSESAV